MTEEEKQRVAEIMNAFKDLDVELTEEEALDYLRNPGSPENIDLETYMNEMNGVPARSKETSSTGQDMFKMIMDLFGGKKAMANDKGMLGKAEADKGIMDYIKQFADYQLGNVDEARKEIADLPSKLKADEPGKIDGKDFNEFGLINEEDGSTEAEEEYSDYRNLKGQRDADGNLVPIADKKVVNTEDTRTKAKPKAKKKESPFGPGYHQRPGTNVWTMNEEDPYWSTPAGRKDLGLEEEDKEEFNLAKFMSLFN